MRSIFPRKTAIAPALALALSASPPLDFVSEAAAAPKKDYRCDIEIRPPAFQAMNIGETRIRSYFIYFIEENFSKPVRMTKSFVPKKIKNDYNGSVIQNRAQAAAFCDKLFNSLMKLTDKTPRVAKHSITFK